MVPLDNIDRYKSPWIEKPQQALEYIDNLFKGSLQTYSKNEYVFFQEDENSFLYIVKEGRVRLSISTHDGNDFHTIIGKPGFFFGESSFFYSYPHDCNAIAIINSKIYVIPYERVASLYNKDSIFTELLVNSLVRKQRVLIDIINNLVSKNAYDRVVNQLINLCHAHGLATDKGIIINIRFTHEELANITNLSRVSVSHVMSDLTKKNIICKLGAHTVVNDMKKLENLLY